MTDEPKRWRRYVAVAGGLIATIGFFALFAGRSTYRMAEQGGDDARWCAFGSTINAIRDNWLLRTGFGAFQDVFPVYRTPIAPDIRRLGESHDFFLEGYLGLGLPFAVAMAIGYFVLIGALTRGVMTRHRYRYVPVMGLGALILVSLHSIVDFSLQIPGLGVYFAAVIAAAVTVSLGRSAE